MQTFGGSAVILPPSPPFLPRSFSHFIPFLHSLYSRSAPVTQHTNKRTHLNQQNTKHKLIPHLLSPGSQQPFVTMRARPKKLRSATAVYLATASLNTRAAFIFHCKSTTTSGLHADDLKIVTPDELMSVRLPKCNDSPLGRRTELHYDCFSLNTWSGRFSSPSLCGDKS